MAGPTTIEAFVSGYGMRLTPSMGVSLARYRIIWNIAALTYEYRAGGDWFDAYLEGIADDTRQLHAQTHRKT